MLRRDTIHIAAHSIPRFWKGPLLGAVLFGEHRLRSSDYHSMPLLHTWAAVGVLSSRVLHTRWAAAVGTTLECTSGTVLLGCARSLYTTIHPPWLTVWMALDG